MKLLLIFPSDKQEKYLPFCASLSLLSVAALTPDNWDIELVDERLNPFDCRTDADLVGITCMTTHAPRAYAIADELRVLGKSVVLGGMHPSAMPEEASQHADALVIGEAEGCWQRLLIDFLEGKLQKIYQSNGYVSLDAIPCPRHDLVRLQDYLVGATQTSRGCPFKCTFCAVTKFFGHKYRVKSVEQAIAEIQSLNDEQMIFFVDDNIVGNPSYAKELFKELSLLRRQWSSQASITMANDSSLLRLMADSGCKFLTIGMESVSQDTLKKMGKGFNKAGSFTESIRKIQDAGIGAVGQFIFGFDDDDKDVFERTVEAGFKMDLTTSGFSILTPLLGTVLYEQYKSDGRMIEQDWAKYDGRHVTFTHPHLSADELLEGLRWAYKQVLSKFPHFMQYQLISYYGLSHLLTVDSDLSIESLGR